MSEMSEDMKLAVQVVERLKLLANPNRLRIACRLMEGELCVGDIQDELGIRQPTLSREIARLRDGGVIKARRQSKTVFYTLTDAKMARLIAAICQASHHVSDETSHEKDRAAKAGAPPPPAFARSPQPARSLPDKISGAFSVFPVINPAQQKQKKEEPDD